MCQRLQCSRAIVWSKEPLHEQAEPMADRHRHCWRRTRGRLAMILRRSIILAIASMPLLARAAYSQTAVKVRYVGLLSSGAPFTDTSEIVTGLTAGYCQARLCSREFSNGPDIGEVYDRASDLSARILRGASPADLPFEQPTRFRLVINKRTMETLGFTIPPAMIT